MHVFLGLSSSQMMFLVAAAVLIILYSIIRLALEALYFYLQLHLYFFDIATWVNVPLYIFAIAFVSVFGRECLCPLEGQWQVGIAAVFLVWAHLIINMRRMRVLGKIFMVLEPMHILDCRDKHNTHAALSYWALIDWNSCS